MIRETLAPGSRHAMMFATGQQGWWFQRDGSRPAARAMTRSASGAAPGWVRLVREGNLFTAYHSTDGTTWTLVGTDTITMASTVYVGLAVTSHQRHGDRDRDVHQRHGAHRDDGDEPAADRIGHEPSAGRLHRAGDVRAHRLGQRHRWDDYQGRSLSGHRSFSSRT